MSEERSLEAVLSGLGFESYGAGWRTQDGDFIVCVEVQVSRDGTSFCVNVGGHYTFMPILGRPASDPPLDLHDLQEPDCVLRTRLPIGGPEMWWPRADTSAAADEFKLSGLPWIKRYSNPSDIFGSLPADIDAEEVWRSLPGVSRALRPVVLSYLLRRMSREAEAVELASIALASRPRSGVRVALKRFLKNREDRSQR